MKSTTLTPAHHALLPLAGLMLMLPAPTLQARGAAAEQALSLVNGWNAVWLEVEPTYPEGHPKAGLPMGPADLFPSQVLTVITPKPLAGTAEIFADDPTNAGTFNQEGWEQWHNPSVVGDNLALITGNRPYLIKVNGNTSLALEGQVRFHRPSWTPDRYNLVGFGLDGAPSFIDFFGPSGGKHPVNRIFRLDPATGNWQLVSGAGPMASNEAYWVFSSGPSEYMGPVAVAFDGQLTGRLNFAGPDDAVQVDEGINARFLDLEELVISNLSLSAATPSLELVTNLAADAGNPDELELYAVRPASDALAYETVARIDSTPDDGSSTPLKETVAPKASATLTIGARRTWASGLAGRTNLYRLKTGAGNAFWVPVAALNNSLQLPSDLLPADAAAVAGLWVGEVSVKAATSVVENGAPVRATSSAAPLRILFHSDSSGAVRLLAQVTIMQTRTADPAVAPETVLVENRARIPFFEGIRERNGKKVGVRLESVAFDMPRDTSVQAQAADPDDPGSDDLLDMIVAESASPVTKWDAGTGRYPDRASVDQEAIDSFLLFRSVRPPALKEVYQLTLPMDGAVGAGKTVRTKPGTLTLDPFHRSNPFRHAYHQRHSKGPQITRELEIVLDSAQPVPDRLTGVYHETVSGLTKSDLSVTGPIMMRRVSMVDTLDTNP
ncbi:MAG: hypothetical protein K9N23_11435 [Akkermansiaceae bacterium]|nr:hypothetical protein [Akkermansiaceae bacterium]